MRAAPAFFCLLLLVSPLRAGETAAATLDRLFAGSEAPDGVVFEIIAWQDNTWDWAAPLLRRHVERLRASYPRLQMALVSHGAELFDLSRHAGLRQQPAIRELARLSAEGLEIHVCGEYAARKRLGTRDFPDFVDVAASGSAQLADYIKLGYAHIRLEPEDAID